jgi:anti-sigma B factor antagonist
MDRSTGPFKVTVDDAVADRLVVTVAGELDLAASDELREILVTAVAAHPVVVVDLAACPFMDSSGLRSLLAAAHRAQESGHLLSLAGVQPAVQRVIELTGMDTVLPTYPDATALEGH